jgi:FSR family fosmidomycin resistance protein-like MFS transporter
MVSIYSITHFLVDFACAFLIFRFAGTPNWYLCVLLYNFFAFAMQMPLGILADVWNRNCLFAAFGCVFVAAAYGLQHVIAAVVVVGIGNALFHIGSGIDILNISEEKSSAIGVFVSPGAWGIYFGAILGKVNDFSSIPIITALFAAAGLILSMYRAHGGTYPKNAAFSLDNVTSPHILLAAACLFLVVCLRSYAGLTFNFPWKSADYLGIALVCAVVLGKAAGGFVADQFGMLRTAFFSLSTAALLFFFSRTPLPGITAVLLFNMTMPITLWAMAKTFPGAKGFSFGLLAFALFLGFLPVYFGLNPPSNKYWPFTLFTVVSLVLLMVGLRKVNLWKRH